MRSVMPEGAATVLNGIEPRSAYMKYGDSQSSCVLFESYVILSVSGALNDIKLIIIFGAA